jgi:hypothetical protein
MDRDATMPTTLAELADYLRDECYQPSAYHLGPDWSSCGDTYCLERTPVGFEAFYVERGQRSEPFWIEPSEAAACACFLALIVGDRSSRLHCIAFSGDVSEIETIGAILASEGVQSKRNDIPAMSGAEDPRFRLFVEGRDKRIVDRLVAAGRIPAVAFG